MRDHGFAIVLLLGLFVGGGYTLLNTPMLINTFGERLIHRALPKAQIEHFHVGRQRFRLPGDLVWEDVDVEWEHQLMPYALKFSRLKITDVLKNWNRKNQILFFGDGASLTNDYGSLEDLAVEGRVDARRQNVVCQGRLSGQKAHLGRFASHGFEVRFRGGPKQWQFQDIRASAYGGEIKGQIVLEAAPEIQSVLWLELLNVSSDELAAVSPDWFGGLTGRWRGSLRINATLDTITLLDLQMSSMGMVSVKPSLLKRIQGFLKEPNPDLKALLDSGAAQSGEINLTFDRVNFYLTSAGNRLIVRFAAEQKDTGVYIMDAFDVIPLEGLMKFFFQWSSPAESFEIQSFQNSPGQVCGGMDACLV